MPLRMWLVIKREVLRKGSREDVRSFLISSYVLMVSISAGHHPLISHILVEPLKGTHLPVRIPENQKKTLLC